MTKPQAWIPLAVFLLAVACRDTSVVAPVPVSPRAWVATAVQCEVAVAAGGSPVASCQSGAAMRGADQASAVANARRMAPAAGGGTPLKPMDVVTLGSQGVQISLTLDAVVYNATAQRVTATAILRNLLDQPLGRDSNLVDSAGVRVFFESAPASDTGTVTVGNADGTGTFVSGTNLPYFVFGAPIPAGLDERREFQFNLAGGARRFSFRVLVSATVPNEASPFVTGAPLFFTEVLASDRGGCAVRSLGTLYCWGANENGMLGQATDPLLLVPTPIPGKRFQRVRIGFNNACGIGDSGDLWCWGNLNLVNGMPQEVVHPVAIPFTRPLSDVVLGESHLCALDDRGAAYCRGVGLNGELGDGTYTDPNYVSYYQGWTAVGGGLRFTSLSAGAHHTCGVTVGGSLYCWGITQYGQTGNASPNPDGEAWPVRVATPTWTSGSRWTQVAVGIFHSCALNSAGEAFCWGRGVDGQVGDSVSYDAYYNPYVDTPQRVRGDTSVRFTTISSGDAHACALTVSTRRLWCWGANFAGEQGDSAFRDSQYRYAHPAAGTRTFADLSLGSTLTCGTVQGGGPLGLHCMGANIAGGLGIGTADETLRDVPTLVSQSTGFTDLSLSIYGGACAKGVNGRHYCWGYNYAGKLGRATRETIARPAGMFTRVPLRGVVALHQGHCALSNTGAPYCWGRDPNFTIQGAVPDSVATTVTFAKLTAGGGEICGLTPAGNAYCWGNGAIGRGYAVPNAIVMPGRPFTSISVSRSSTINNAYSRACAVTDIGEIYCWGYNNGGSLLGAASDTIATAPVTVPVRVPTGLLRFTQVSVSDAHICALSTVGEAYCWGIAGYGAIGDGVERGASDQVRTPTKAAGGLVFAELHATTTDFGYGRACGLTKGGAVFCWGYGPSGIAGLNTYTTETVPRRVQSDVNFESLSLGANHNCGRTANGAVWCWGDNTYGQIGNGENMGWAAVPTRLVIP